MKKLYLLIILLFIIISLKSQTLPDPGTRSTTNFTDVVSDFGPRNFTNMGTASVFHPAIDYSINGGDYFYPVEDGTLTNFGALGQAYGYIDVGNWRYMHFLQGMTPDKHWEFTFITVNQNTCNVIIQRSGPLNNLQTERIIAPSTCKIDAYIDPRTSDNTPIPIESQIHQNDAEPIFMHNHLNHLDLRRTNYTQNPFTYVAHSNTQNPILEIKCKYVNGTVATNFASNIIYGTQIILQVKADIRTDKDLDEVEIAIKKDGSNLNSLKKWKYTGASQVPVSQIIRLQTVNAIENSITSGVYPQLADIPQDVSIDYFKHTWNSRKKVGSTANANCIVESEYEDGFYDILTTVRDITNNDTTDTNRILIDNFIPFIEKIEVRNNSYNGSLIYKGEWTWNSTLVRLEFSSETPGVATTLNGLWINVFASEAMQNLSLSLFGNITNLETAFSGSDGKQFSFYYPPGTATPGIHNLVVSGNSLDLVGNKLQGYTEDSSVIQANAIPLRLTDSTWSASLYERNDTRHKFVVIKQGNTPVENMQGVIISNCENFKIVLINNNNVDYLVIYGDYSTDRLNRHSVIEHTYSTIAGEYTLEVRDVASAGVVYISRKIVFSN